MMADCRNDRDCRVGYYYGGPSGTVQVITYTGRRLFEDYRKEFEEFLNGFRVEP